MISSATASSMAPPSFYEESMSYGHLWKQYKESLETRENNTLVSDSAFYPQAPFRSEYLLACTSTGLLYIWKLPPLQFPNQDSIEMDDMMGEQKEDEEDDENDLQVHLQRLEQRRGSGYAKPIRRFLIASPPHNRLYTIQISHIHDRALVLIGGDMGVIILDWQRDLFPSINSSSQGGEHAIVMLKDLDMTTSSSQPFPKFCPYPSPTKPSGIVEINDIYVDTTRGHLYGAAGDAFGCYKWDLECQKLIATYPSPGHGYLHCVGAVPGNSSHALLTGGEDGILGIWDTRLDRSVDQIDLNNMNPSSNSTTTSTNRSPALFRRHGTGTTGIQQRPCWISSFVARDENWWVLSGGYFSSTTSSSYGSSACGGFLSTWHGPTRSLVAHIDRRERPQRLALFKEHVVSVANESWVSHWDLFSLERVGRVRCDPVMSGYGVTVDHDGRIAVSGIGSSILLYEQGTHQTGRLDLQVAT